MAMILNRFHVTLLLLGCCLTRFSQGFAPHLDYRHHTHQRQHQLDENDNNKINNNNVAKRSSSPSSFVGWQLYMAKSINKQAELRRRMEFAKKQKEAGNDNPVVGKDGMDDVPLTDKEIKERNDRRRFEDLLKKSSSTALNDYSSDGYLNKQQEEEEIDAYRKGVDRIFEGDPAPIHCFEELHNIQTESPIKKAGMERLVPWLNNKSTNPEKEYLVCLSDPRDKSLDLRESVKALQSQLPKQILDRLIIINADSPAENRRWLKRQEMEQMNSQVYSDEKKEWMRAYTALGEKRWSMTVFVISGGKVQKLAREVDSFAVGRVIQKAVQAVEEERRL